jgi:hypothetical protein
MKKSPQKNCDMCLMPFSQDPGVRDTENYCSYCHHDGAFSYTGTDVQEFKALTYAAMRKKGIGWAKAKFFTFVIGFAPHWKKSATDQVS